MSTNNPNPRPTRRNFLLAAPVAAAGAVALAGTRPAAAAGRRRPDLEPHNEYNASMDVCSCRECVDVRMARGAHPLHHAAVLAAYRAEVAVEAIQAEQPHDCACGGCDACCVLAHVPIIRFHLAEYRAALECDHSPDPATERAAKVMYDQLHGARPLPRPRPSRHGNLPGHEQALVALYDLRDACDALVAGHHCDGGCETCDDAEGVAGGAGVWIGILAPYLYGVSEIDARL